MLQIVENYQHSHITTWRIPYKARYYCALNSIDQLRELKESEIYQNPSIKKQFIGKGANTLFKRATFDGLLISIQLMGKEKVDEDEEYEYWKIGAGEDWCELVRFFALEKQLAGIENLALIPGLVGAAPIQNIAAYGQTFESVCSKVHAFDIEQGEKRYFTNEECRFSYRGSIFKEQISLGRKHLIITAVILKLKKSPTHLITSYDSNYESLTTILAQKGRPPYTLKQVYEAVVQIRNNKLPSINEVGTNGSVFMNPIVSGKKLHELLRFFPDLQFYLPKGMHHRRMPQRGIVPTDKYKIAAGHILEKIGWRKRTDDGNWVPIIINEVGVWAGHSLVLVNYGTKNPVHIYDYLTKMQQSFIDHTGINIVPEINLID